MRISIMLILAIGLALGVAWAQTQPAATGAPSPAIQDGSKVQLEYTLADQAGKVLDSSKGRPPLEYTHGRRQIIPGLEKALEGMHTGDTKTVTVKPADAYGEVDPNAVTEVPKEKIPAGALTVGTELAARGANGEQRLVRVKEIKDKTVVIDLNHPLAGKTLVFDVKVMGVEATAPPAEPATK